MNKCKQCGQCCKKEICEVGRKIYETTAPPCPALVRVSYDRYLCGVVKYSGVVDKELPKLFAEALGIGKGCDSDFIEV